jgi:hypothetical protein
MFTYPAILALLLTVALTGCQQDSLPQAGDAFRFSVGAVGVSSAPTKAYAYADPVDYLGTEGSSVKVWSQIQESGSWKDLFSSPSITLSKASSWASPETRYWTRNASYRFRAVAPANAPGLVNTSNIEEIKVSYNFLTGNYDLMVASVAAGTLGSATVPLLFRHACAAVRFFILDPGRGNNNARYFIKKFELKNLYSDDTFISGTTDSWESGTSRSRTDVYQYEKTDPTAYWPVPAPKDPDNNDAFTDWFYFVPQPLTDSKGTACISLEFKAGDQIIPVSKDLKDLCASWEAGKKYTYVITIEPKGIGFDVQWTEWNDENTDHDYGTIG